MTEVWIIEGGDEKVATKATIMGRIRVPFLQKLNVRWWFQNDAEQTVDQAPWFEQNIPQAQREADWNNRNPAQNLRAFVLGVQDKNYTIWGKAPIKLVQRDDLTPPERGWQWCWLYSGDLWIPRFFVSRVGTSFTWYFGWQPSGFFGAKFVPAAKF